MKSLIVEDEFSSRLILQKILGEYGEVHIAANGKEATEAVKSALKEQQPYDLITLDVMMPEMTGHEALRTIRDMEELVGIQLGQGSRIIMSSALGDGKTIMGSFKERCDGYLVKPIDKQKLIDYLKTFNLI